MKDCEIFGWNFTFPPKGKAALIRYFYMSSRCPKLSAVALGTWGLSHIEYSYPLDCNLQVVWEKHWMILIFLLCTEVGLRKYIFEGKVDNFSGWTVREEYLWLGQSTEFPEANNNKKEREKKKGEMNNPCLVSKVEKFALDPKRKC